jgi:ribonucleoside-triphosphate reductase
MNEESLANLIVVKRSGKKVNFDGTKIAIAIKKGFDSIEGKYDEDDVNKIYTKVIEKIIKGNYEKIQIEEIQDLIEEALKNNNYIDVYDSFADYREKRNQSREIFFEEKRKHKFLKALEKLGLSTKETSEEISRDKNTTEILQSYGSTVAEEFATSYLMKKRHADAHENGDIYINKLEYYPMGTTESCQIDLEKLFAGGFDANNSSMREPKSISSYIMLACVAIASNQHDQDGEQSIPSFDYYMAPGIIKTFKKEFRQSIYDILEYTDFDKFIAINGIEREIDKISSIDFDIEIFYKFTRESEELKRMFRIVYANALRKTERSTYQALEGFVHDINSICEARPITVNLGTDTSKEGRMITKNILKTICKGIGENKKPINPKVVFKIKEGINLKESDPNYDLLKEACEAAIQTKNISFSFLDTQYNSQFYKEGDYNTEVAYFSDGSRIIDNYIDKEKEVVGGRGVISSTVINLPRIAFRHRDDEKGFFDALDQRMHDVKDQLLERLEIQSNKRVYNFPFLMKQFVWFDSDRLREEDDKVRRILKQGSMQISFTGLSEALILLTKNKDLDNKKAKDLGLKIINKMQQNTIEFSKKYGLNFVLAGNENKDLDTAFLELDRVIFGKVEAVTDKDRYTSSFELAFEKDVEKKIKWEAPFFEIVNGGHMVGVTLPEVKGIKDEKEKLAKEVDELLKTIKLLHKNEIGYAVIEK